MRPAFMGTGVTSGKAGRWPARPPPPSRRPSPPAKTGRPPSRPLIAGLDDRERRIIHMRFVDEPTQTRSANTSASPRCTSPDSSTAPSPSSAKACSPPSSAYRPHEDARERAGLTAGRRERRSPRRPPGCGYARIEPLPNASATAGCSRCAHWPAAALVFGLVSRCGFVIRHLRRSAPAAWACGTARCVRVREGPYFDAAQHSSGERVFRIEDLTEHASRWPPFVPAARDLGIGIMIGSGIKRTVVIGQNDHGPEVGERLTGR